MESRAIFALILVSAAGFISGSSPWPIKLMKKYQFEHWWLIAMITGLVVVPWTVTLVYCPNVVKACASVPLKTLIIANLWAMGWGVANILAGICYVRIGLSLTTAILAGLGLTIGPIMPMIVKGSGIFQNASDLDSLAGRTLLVAIGLMLAATALIALAGFGREKAPGKWKSQGFAKALFMAVAAGILSSGMSLSFVYGQAAVVNAMTHEGAGQIPATFAVWALCLLGGAIPSLAYPCWLATKKRSWGVFTASWREMALAVIIGINVTASVALLGCGMLMLGALGAAVGIGIQQATWTLGGQAVGIFSGEWRGVSGRTRAQMFSAIILLFIAVLVMIHVQTLAK